MSAPRYVPKSYAVRSHEFGKSRHIEWRQVDESNHAERVELVAAQIQHRFAVEILAASETSIRGTRPQKIRCDEVDLFNPDVWEAAQLTTRSATLTLEGGGTRHVRGSVECLSTMHVPHGVMHRLVQEARGGARALFRWGVVDVLESCPEGHRCAGPGDEPRCGLLLSFLDARGRAGDITLCCRGEITSVVYCRRWLLVKAGVLGEGAAPAGRAPEVA